MSNTFENMSDTHILPKGILEHYIVAGIKDKSLHKYGIQVVILSEVYPPYLVIKKASPYHIVVYSVSGKGRYRNDYDVGIFKPGFFWVSPAKHHHLYQAEGEWTQFCFLLADIESWQFLHEWKGGIQPSLWISQIQEAMEGYIAESIYPGNDARQAERAFGDLIGVYLKRDLIKQEAQMNRRTCHKLDILWREVNSKLQHPWTVDKLARVINVSSGHLYRLVSLHNQASPIGMVTKLRIKKAKELLLHTDYPIKVISGLTGYNNPYSFSKAFKRHTGRSPGAFRR